MYSLRSRYWPAYTWKIQTSFSSEIDGKISNELNITQSDFKRMYFNIFHKINASFYHLQKLKENQDIAIAIGRELAKLELPDTSGLSGIAGVPYEPIEYEYEALLVTIKSALDFISIFISASLGTKGDNILSLLNEIKSKKPKPNTLEEKIYSYLESSQFSTIFDNFRDPDSKAGKKSYRNYAVHKGSLPVGTTNVPINNPEASILLTKVLNPNEAEPHTSLLNSQNLIDYCEIHFYKTCDVFIGILSLVMDRKFVPGPKKSIYELRKTS